MNDLILIECLIVLHMLDHHIRCVNQICTQRELVHFGGNEIEFTKGHEITWRQGFLFKGKTIDLAW